MFIVLSHFIKKVIVNLGCLQTANYVMKYSQSPADI